ncbi:MAG: isoleucine--tRNA ligase [Elusimicrobiota bacterium]
MAKKYNKTLNLPSTSFSMRAKLREKEPSLQKMWKEMNIEQKRLDNNSEGEKYILHDGPPYANGHIHMGHALNRILKDIIVKYKSMRGFYAPFVPGWDCHGLPVEYELLKQMGKSGAGDKVKFRKKAARYALKYVKIQKKEFKRLGLSGDWDNPYLTLNKSYEETIVDSFSRLYMDGYIYRELKPVYWCFSCRTALAEAEVEYADAESPSVFIKFEMVSGRPSFLSKKEKAYALIWTTTPWTIPSNTALCFHPDSNYVFLREKEDSVIIVAEELAFKFPSLEKVGSIKGSELSGTLFKRPFSSKTSPGITAEYVSMEEGSGIVHIAPGHGDDDYIAGKEFGLEILSPVDEKGRFTEDAGVEEIKGKNVFEANSLIMDILERKKLLFKKEKDSHSYPHCWRCKKPLIFRATRQWFLNVDEKGLREKILNFIKRDVRWLPQAGEKRMKAMIHSRPDWCLSRQRMWGVPVPVFYCSSCGRPLATKESFRKVKEMIREYGSDGWFFLSSEEILGSDFKCSCSESKFLKENDILDVWFDSGVSNMAVLQSRSGHKWPADMYLEGSDQHRGWFQTSLIPAVAIKEAPPYKAVLTHGFIVDEEGKKMSKSVGNVISPLEVVEKYGADLLRLWVSTENYYKDVKISQEILSHTVSYYRRIRNTIRFILGNCRDLTKDTVLKYEEMTDLDKFILHEFSLCTEKVIKNYERNLFYKSAREIHDFCNEKLSSFYFNIIKDRLYVSHPLDLKRRASQSALFHIGQGLLSLISPILPHTAEEGWQKMKKEIPVAELEESVLLSSISDCPGQWRDESLFLKWKPLTILREKVMKEIEKAKNSGVIKDPLESVLHIQISKGPAADLLLSYADFLKEFFIVSEVGVDTAGSFKKSDSFMESDISIEVKKARGKKCSRCWLIDTDTGLDNENPDTCPRCSAILKKITAEENSL